MNTYDSARMKDMLGATDDMVETDTPEDADVILLNTCSIREKAEDKVFSHLGRFIPLKEKKSWFSDWRWWLRSYARRR